MLRFGLLIGATLWLGASAIPALSQEVTTPESNIATITVESQVDDDSSDVTVKATLEAKPGVWFSDKLPPTLRVSFCGRSDGDLASATGTVTSRNSAFVRVVAHMRDGRAICGEVGIAATKGGQQVAETVKVEIKTK